LETEGTAAGRESVGSKTSVAQGNGGRTRSAWFVMGAVIVVQTLAIVGLAIAFALMSSRQVARLDEKLDKLEGVFGFTEEMVPSAEDAELYAKGEEVGLEVGYLVEEKDLDGYMALYREGDASVDMAEVEAAFTKAMDRTGDEPLEFYSEYTTAYEDKDTGERLVRITVSGENIMGSGGTGVRLVVWALVDEAGVVLSGGEGRDLEVIGSPYL